jgi:Bacterial membrane protein YfhO
VNSKRSQGKKSGGGLIHASRETPAHATSAGIDREAIRHRMIRRAGPYFALLLFTVLFYRGILFGHDTFIPWDLPGYHLPQAVFASRALHAGHLPLWDPYTFCGRPLYAEIQAQVFYPFRIVTLLLVNPSSHLGVMRALEIELVLHVLFAGVFVLWLARRLGLRGPAALLSASAFPLGCYFASQAEHIGAVEAASWLPLAWFAVVLLHEKATFARFSLLTAALTLMFLAGFTPAAILMFGSVALFSVLWAVVANSGIRPVVVTGVAMATVFLLAAIQVFPTRELADLSLGSTRAGWRGTGGGLPIPVLMTVLLPNYLGGFSWDTFNRTYEITLAYLYCGSLTVLLVVVGMLVRPSRIKAILLAMLCLAGVWMLGDSTPVGTALFLAMPRFIQGPMYPQHWMVVFSLCMALLCGFGMQALSFLKGWGYVLVVVSALDLIAMSSSRPMNTTGLDPASIGIDLAVDGERTALAAVREAAASSVPPPRIDVFEHEATVWANAGTLTGLPSANGEDPLALIRILKARGGLNGGTMWAYSPVQHIKPALLSAMNVKYVMAKAPIAAQELNGSRLSVYKSFPGRTLYENAGVLPRFFFVPRVKLSAGVEQSIEVMNHGGWDPSQEAVVENLAIDPAQFAAGEVRVLHYSDQKVLLRTQTAGRGFLVSSEANYPGWHATIDGRETQIYYTNGAFRGIVVPAGEHTIAFAFSPTVLYRSALVSLLTLLGMCVGLCITCGKLDLTTGRLYLAIALEKAARKVRP